MLNFLSVNRLIVMIISAGFILIGGCAAKKSVPSGEKEKNYFQKITSKPTVSIDKIYFSKFNYNQSVDFILSLKIKNNSIIPFPKSKISINIFLDENLLGTVDEKSLAALGSGQEVVVPVTIRVYLNTFIGKNDALFNNREGNKIKIDIKLNVFLIDFDFTFVQNFLHPIISINGVSLDNIDNQLLFNIEFLIINNTKIDAYYAFDLKVLMYNKIIIYHPYTEEKDYLIKANSKLPVNYSMVINKSQINRTLEKIIRNQGILAYQLQIKYKYGIQEGYLTLDDRVKLPMYYLLRLNLTDWQE